MGHSLSLLFIDDCASVCETLAYQAKSLGDEVSLVLHKRGLSTYQQLAQDTVLTDTTRMTRTLLAVSRIRDIRKLDAVVVSSRVGWATGAAIKAIFGTKMVAVLHGSDIRRLPRVSSLKRKPLLLALKRSSHLFYASLDLEASTRKINRPYSRLKYPIDTDIFAKEGEAAPLAGEPSVFIPTRLDSDKGFSKIGKLVAHVLDNYPRARVYAVRWPGTGEVLRALKADNLDRVEMLDFIGRTSMPRYYRGASVVVGQMHLGFGSMTECEAMSCGAPVVFYDRFYGYGSPEPGAEAIWEFFDSLVSDGKFRRNRISFGLRLIEEAHDSRKVLASFRDIVGRIPSEAA